MQQEKSILQTLAFWDIFAHPLTGEELFSYLYLENNQKIVYTDFLNQLASVPHQDGFYFLPGQEKNVAVRQLKVKLIDEKLKIAQKGIRKLAKVPFVRAVFVCNTVAMGIADEDSDIDVLIIVRKGRIWLARFLATVILSLSRRRRTKNKIANKICLSFYLADDNLNLSKVAISQPDIYLIYWLNNLIPVYDPEYLHASLLKANQWVKKYLPNGLQGFLLSENCKMKLGIWKKLWEKMWGGKYGDLIEKQAKGIQQAKMKRNVDSAQSANDTRVVINDGMLKFHEKDRREEYQKLWLEKCEKYA